MERGAVPLADLPGGLDLRATLESGQSYCWTRSDGGMYGTAGGLGDGTTDLDAAGDRAPWYETVVDGEVVRARQVDGRLEWESTTDAVPVLRELLRLDDDLPAIRAAAPEDPLLERAWDAAWGMRIVKDPPFRTLVSFICSAQMRVERIHEMQRTLAATYGDEVVVDGETYHAFPTPERLAATTEADLRDLGLGYRAPYVLETARMVADGEAHPAEAADMDYEAAREWLTRFVGVGQKVADCVCLFSLGFLQAVPLDTWIRTAIADHYPDCDCGTYAETSRAIREAFGGAYAGYAQTYVFDHLRTGRD